MLVVPVGQRVWNVLNFIERFGDDFLYGIGRLGAGLQDEQRVDRFTHAPLSVSMYVCAHASQS